MRPDVYASLAAFLAHRRALNHAGAGGLSMDELVRSAEMEQIIASLRPEERAALEGASADAPGEGAIRRHRERAEANLARELRRRGLLTP